MKNDIMIDKTHKNIIIINGTLKLKGMDLKNLNINLFMMIIKI
jgi:hypothetical protein